MEKLSPKVTDEVLIRLLRSHLPQRGDLIHHWLRQRSPFPKGEGVVWYVF